MVVAHSEIQPPTYTAARAMAPRSLATIPTQAESDAQLLALWLHGRPMATHKGYSRHSRDFLNFVGKPLRQIILADLQRYADSLAHLAPASQATILAAVKSLFSFAHKLGYIPFDIGGVVRLPAVKNTLVERILSEEDVRCLIGTELNQRNRLILGVLYTSGMRLSELCTLTWRDMVQRDDAVQLTVFGKRGRTRAVLLPPDTSRALLDMRGDSGRTDPIFRTVEGDPLSKHEVWFIVKTAALRAGLPKGTSPHWLRHAHCSHAMDHGAPIHLVAATVGHSNIATTSRYLHARPGESSSRFLKTPELDAPIAPTFEQGQVVTWTRRHLNGAAETHRGIVVGNAGSKGLLVDILEADGTTRSVQVLPADLKPARVGKAGAALPRQRAQVDGTEIRRIRLERGLSTRALAKETGVSHGHLTEIELGTSSPGPGTAALLRSWLDKQHGAPTPPRPPGYAG